MDRKHKVLLFCVAVLSVICLFLFRPPLTGHISTFRYRSGHAWFGHQILEIIEENGNYYAVSSWEPGMMENVYHEGPQEGKILLSQEQVEAFDALLLKTLRLPDWKDYYWPVSMRTDQDSWSITYTWNGTEYKTGGYDTYPKGLQKIYRFFLDFFPIES